MVGSYIKGEEGTDVTVTVYRETTDEYLNFTMTRSNIETPTVEHEMLPDGIGYVLVTQFEGVTAGQFKAAVEDLEGQGMEKLIIDLRNNPGGLLDAGGGDGGLHAAGRDHRAHGVQEWEGGRLLFQGWQADGGDHRPEPG